MHVNSRSSWNVILNKMDFKDKILSDLNQATFEELALEIYHFQVENIPVYREYVKHIGRKQPTHYTEIPFLPISFFKTHKVCKADLLPEVIFKSSGTTGQIRSQHLVEDVQIYQNSFQKAYNALIGNPENQVILALLPNYIEQGESSLVYMVDQLVRATKNSLSGFLLNNPSEIKQRYSQALASGKDVVIFGVSYALLDLAEQKMDLSQARIIETGGMKGRRKELTKAELHSILQKGLGVPYISSEYGMTELLSQGYSDKNGDFITPAWMKILIREVNDPFSYVEDGKTGGINVIDLANVHSCAFIATQDLGKKWEQTFQILGRFDHSDIRGCNLLMN